MTAYYFRSKIRRGETENRISGNMFSPRTEASELTPKVLDVLFVISCGHYLFLGDLVLQ